MRADYVTAYKNDNKTISALIHVLRCTLIGIDVIYRLANEWIVFLNSRNGTITRQYANLKKSYASSNDTPSQSKKNIVIIEIRYKNSEETERNCINIAKSQDCNGLFWKVGVRVLTGEREKKIKMAVAMT